MQWITNEDHLSENIIMYLNQLLVILGFISIMHYNSMI